MTLIEMDDRGAIELVARIASLVDRITAALAEKACGTDPNAPHGFDRNASHSENRYVCECEHYEAMKPTERKV